MVTPARWGDIVAIEFKMRVTHSAAWFILLAIATAAEFARGQTIPHAVDFTVSARSVPFAAEPGTYEEIYSVVTPAGKLVLHTNLDYSTIAYAGLSDIGAPIELLSPKAGSASQVSFYGQKFSNISQSAIAFQNGNTYYIPINSNPGGNCNSGNNIYIIKWTTGSAPSLSPPTNSIDGCLKESLVNATNNGIKISIYLADDLKKEDWLYDETANRMTFEGAQTYSPPAGFTPLFSPVKPLVQSLKFIDENSRFDIEAGAIIHDGQAQASPDIGANYIGLGSKVLYGDHRVYVLAVVQPSQTNEPVFQLISVSFKSISVSRYFGADCPYLSYEVKDNSIFLDAASYNSSQMPIFIDQHFEITDGMLVPLHSNSQILPSTTLPATLTPAAQ